MKIKTLKVKPTYVPQRGLRKLGAGEERVYLVLQVTDSLTPLVNLLIWCLQIVMFIQHE